MAIVTQESEIAALRASGRIAAAVLKKVAATVKPGLTTANLDELAADLLKRADARPSFLHYQGYPANLCVSVNDEVVHGIPGDRMLVDGDVVSLDIGVNLNGWFTDHAVTIPVGRITAAQKKLIADTQQSLMLGLAAAKIGGRIGDIGAAIQGFLEPRGYGVVRQLCGHGVGRAVHEPPQIPNYGQPKTGPIIVRGAVLAIEPMVTAGGWEVETQANNWTVVSADGSTAAHFEHTVIMTDQGAEIITQL